MGPHPVRVAGALALAVAAPACIFPRKIFNYWRTHCFNLSFRNFTRISTQSIFRDLWILHKHNVIDLFILPDLLKTAERSCGWCCCCWWITGSRARGSCRRVLRSPDEFNTHTKVVKNVTLLFYQWKSSIFSPIQIYVFTLRTTKTRPIKQNPFAIYFSLVKLIDLQSSLNLPSIYYVFEPTRKHCTVGIWVMNIWIANFYRYSNSGLNTS